MPLDITLDPVVTAQRWLSNFNTALGAADPAQIAACLREDSHWRDVLAFEWSLTTTSGQGAIAAKLCALNENTEARAFTIDPDRLVPRIIERAGCPVVEAFVSFETAVGPCTGLVRIRAEDVSDTGCAAWTLMTALHEIRGSEEATIQEGREEPAFLRDFHGPNWAEKRDAARAYKDHDPTVLVVGGGHAGITAAARLDALGVDTLVIDKEQRIGDNWRLRYHGLKLHNQPPSNHMPYLPFPKTWQKYTPKDKIANWLEFYVETLDINFWTETALEGATYDPTHKCWTANVRLADGNMRVMHPRHIIVATGVSATPNIPDIPSLENFGGTVLHTSQFNDGAEWKDKDVTILGVGTSAHDVAQDLEGHGARVTMVQRSASVVVNVEPSAQMYDGVFFEEGPSIEDKDLISISIPLDVVKQVHKHLTDQVRVIDKPILDGLAAKGFKLHFGEDGTGWNLLFRTRGGGYYFNIGGSELIVEGRVGLTQWDDMEGFTADGYAMKDGTQRNADLIVLATGFKGFEHAVETMFGTTVLDRVGQIWGFDDNQELANMWMATPQPGLWFTAGAFSQCRMFSKYLALQIKARELGLV
ncbi:MAG: NAD(P)/FAD-dependent oxidoreductase [Rhodospirillaceae bacterium]|nr:NAD(P)/FAD-dependent oxidoreductase [Rhodospirillaceae bacterium]